MEEHESRIIAVNAQLYEGVSKLPTASLDAAAAAIQAAFASMNPETPVSDGPLGEAYRAIAGAAASNAEASAKVTRARTELTAYIAGLGVSVSASAGTGLPVAGVMPSAAETPQRRVIVRSAAELQAVVSVDQIAMVAYGAMASAVREPGLNNHDTAAHRPYCDIVTPSVTKLVTDNGITGARSEHHVNMHDDIHWFTSVFNQNGSTGDDIIADTVYKQFVRATYWRTLPNVFVGTRAEMVALMGKYGLPGLIPRIQKLYLPETLESALPS